ncbi:DUF2306 domain-containing protein [Peribacillus loiseleuriae]|uniref:Membrane protein n=1 Tax=Peribacillus loiseleuriae TaxID=1679170 RepID=A0A0K9GPM7_9BACI|nr:DUF2306 domain-containing protein [Peribacillus loiseleuriae]KMY48531.1 membrane protein [Peribacillus loiseleuriae]
MKQKKSWWILVIVSLGVIIPFMAPYLTFNPAKSRAMITSTTLQYPILVTHIIFAFISLITGFLQFIDRIRIKNPHIHRYIGKIYVSSVFVSGILALVVTFYIKDFTKAVAFLTLAILWLFTCWKGYRMAIIKDFKEHRIWMMRNFGLTLVAVTARIFVPVLLLTYYILNGFTLPEGREKMIEEILNVNIWVGIVLNFVIVEWSIMKKEDNSTIRNNL